MIESRYRRLAKQFVPIMVQMKIQVVKRRSINDIIVKYM